LKAIKAFEGLQPLRPSPLKTIACSGFKGDLKASSFKKDFKAFLVSLRLFRHSSKIKKDFKAFLVSLSLFRHSSKIKAPEIFRRPSGAGQIVRKGTLLVDL
jgi:hypothetical protein